MVRILTIGKIQPSHLNISPHTKMIIRFIENIENAKELYTSYFIHHTYTANCSAIIRSCIQLP